MGKNGVTPNLMDQVRDNLTAHEIVKVRVGDNCFDSLDEMMRMIEERARCKTVQCIGNTMLFYRPNTEKPVKRRSALLKNVQYAKKRGQKKERSKRKKERMEEEARNKPPPPPEFTVVGMDERFE